MARKLQNFSGGEWVDATGEDVHEIVSPVSGETSAEAPSASEEDVARAAAAAREVQPRWGARSAWDRAEAVAEIEETAENFRLAAETGP